MGFPKYSGYDNIERGKLIAKAYKFLTAKGTSKTNSIKIAKQEIPKRKRLPLA